MRSMISQTQPRATSKSSERSPPHPQPPPAPAKALGKRLDRRDYTDEPHANWVLLHYGPRKETLDSRN